MLGKKSILKVFIFSLLLLPVLLALIPTIGGTWHPPQPQRLAETQLKQIHTLYITYTQSGARFKLLDNLETLKATTPDHLDHNTIFSIHNPIEDRQFEVTYNVPESLQENEVIFYFDTLLPASGVRHQDRGKILETAKYVVLYENGDIRMLTQRPND